MKRLIVSILLLTLLMSAVAALAQEATPEPTAEATSDAGDPITLTEIFADLPQTQLEDGGFVVGDPDAPITIIEFADFACPHCQAYREVMDEVITNLVATGQAKFEFRIYPTAGGTKTYVLAKVLECAEEQREGAFWEGYELMYGYAVPGDYEGDVPRLFSRELGINYTEMATCTEAAEQIDADITFADEAGVSGTPGVRVRYGDGDPQVIVYDGVSYERGGVPYEVLAAVVEDANNGVIPTAEPGEDAGTSL